MRNPFREVFERRSAIGTSHDLWTHLVRGTRSSAGTVVNENTAFNVAVVLTCVSLRSRAIASLPIRVYERIDDRSKKPAVSHPLSRVLFRPNSWQTRSELFGMLEAHRVLRGNAYAWINRVTIAGADGVERDQVVELVPMHPDRVVVEEPEEFGAPTIYKLRKKRNGQEVPIPASEVLHLKGLSTDGRMGRSVLQDMREAIGGALATQEYGNSFWSRGANPSVVITHPGDLTQKAKDGLEESWERIYGGKDGRRAAVIDEGMKIEPLSLTAEDAQFLETRKFSRSELAGALHVPPHMVGDTEKSTSWGTGIEQQQIGFVVFTMQPDLVCWEQRMNLDLVTRPDKYFLEFSVNGMMRGDATSRANFYWRMVQMGAMSPNDVRGLENMNPIANGDVYLQPTNMAPLGFDPSERGTAA